MSFKYIKYLVVPPSPPVNLSSGISGLLLPFLLVGEIFRAIGVAGAAVINTIFIAPINFLIASMNFMITAAKTAALITTALVTSPPFWFALLGAAVVAGALYLAQPYIRPAIENTIKGIRGFFGASDKTVSEGQRSQVQAAVKSPAAQAAAQDTPTPAIAAPGASPTSVEVQPSPVSSGRPGRP